MNLDTIAILDTETTGVDPAVDRIVEIAVVLWSVRHTCLISARSELVRGPDNPAEAVNRIPAGALDRGMDLAALMAEVRIQALLAGAVVAHNAGFDRAFLAEDLGRPWICSMDDVAWPRSCSSRSLTSIALTHDVAVATAHRALADCLLLARLFERCAELGHNVRVMLERGLRPKATYRAIVSYDDREKAKSNGFSWDGGTKLWTRRMACEDVAALPFRVAEVRA